MTTPAGPAAGAPPARQGNVFTRKIGPLPMWGWLLIGLALIAVYVIYAYRKKNQSASTSTAAAAGSTTGAAQVPQFVNQVNTYGQAPAAPAAPAQTSQAHRNWKGNPKPAGSSTGSSGSSTSSTGSGASSTAPAAPAQYSLAPGKSQSGGVPNLNGMTLSSAIAALQKAGYGISSVSYNYQNITGAEVGQFANTQVVSYTPSGNTVAIGLW